MTWKDAAAPLREPNFRWYFASRFVNTLGNMMAGVAMAFAVLEIDDSAVFSLGWNLAMQENVEESMLSRAYSYDALGSFVAMPIGQIAYGPLGEAFGYADVLVVSGVAYFAICLLTLMSRSVRELPRRAPTEAAAPAPG